MDLKNQILNALGLSKDEEVKLEYQAKLIDGTIIVSSADDLAEGSDVSILAEDGTTMPLPAGTYEVEDSITFVVEEEGIVASIMETEEEEVEEDETEAKKEDEEYYEEVEASDELVEDVIEEEVTEEVRHPKKIKTTEEVEFNKEELINEIGSVVKELLSEVKSDLERLDAELRDMKGVNEELEVEKETLSAQLEELSKEPASEPVSVNKFSETKETKEITPVDLRNMTRTERYWYNINKNK
tara:strand:+ start:194 stop:919 length:726 start_codon:yes stop_codon:yes gene_type:complete